MYLTKIILFADVTKSAWFLCCRPSTNYKYFRSDFIGIELKVAILYQVYFNVGQYLSERNFMAGFMPRGLRMHADYIPDNSGISG